MKGKIRFFGLEPELNGPDLHDLFFKSLVRHPGFIFDLAFICIDRINGVTKYSCNFLGIMYTHPDECKNPQIRIEQFPFL